jgi:hypothetical protein
MAAARAVEGAMRSLLLVSVLAACVVGCGTKVPKKWDSLVPQDGRGQLGYAKVGGKNDRVVGDETLALHYKNPKLSAEELSAAFGKNLQAQGYSPFVSCGSGSNRYAKAPAEVVDVVFTMASPEFVQVFVGRTDKFQGTRVQAPCEFSDFASKFCASTDSGTCTMAQ